MFSNFRSKFANKKLPVGFAGFAVAELKTLLKPQNLLHKILTNANEADKNYEYGFSHL